MGKYAAPIAKLIERLTFHVGTGELAAGIKFRDKPKKQVDGNDDFPIATLFIPTLTESVHAGGRSRGHGHGVMLFNVSVAVAWDKGIGDLMVACEKVMDAVFTKHNGSGEFDASLDGTLAVPAVAKIGNAFVLDTSLNADITFTVQTQSYHLNDRRT